MNLEIIKNLNYEFTNYDFRVGIKIIPDILKSGCSSSAFQLKKLKLKDVEQLDKTQRFQTVCLGSYVRLEFGPSLCWAGPATIDSIF